MNHSLIGSEDESTNWYLVFKYLHIMAVVVCVGGLFARQRVRSQANNFRDIQSFASYGRAAHGIDTAMVIPGMFAILVFGVITGLIGRAPILGFLQGAPQNWLLVSNLLIISLLVVTGAIIAPRSRRLRSIVDRAAAIGEFTPELREAMDDQVVRWAHWYEEAVVVVIAALMVLKPF